MTPFEKAHKLHPGAKEFTLVLEAHLLHGRVICTDKIFLMARPVWSQWPDERMLDAWDFDDDGDCWYVWDLAGEIDQLRLIPDEWMKTRKYIASHTAGRIRRMRGMRYLAFRKS